MSHLSHLSDEELILLHYGESGPSPHLKECQVCQAAARSLAESLDAFGDWAIPEPDAELGRTVWAQIAPRLEDRRRRAFQARWWVAGLAMAALLMVAFALGRGSRPVAPAITAGLSKQARARILEITLADHLDRAGMLLTEISNSGDIERGRAQDLVEEGRLLRQTLAGQQSESATTGLLDEVERLMLEVANAPDRLTPGELQGLQQRIEAGSLIFKIRIIESNLRTEGQKV